MKAMLQPRKREGIKIIYFYYKHFFHACGTIQEERPRIRLFL